MNPIDPASSAARIAAMVNTTEAKPDPRSYRTVNERRREELLEEARRHGLGDHAFRDPGFDRTLSRAAFSEQPVADAVLGMREQSPAWFVEPPTPSASKLVEQLRSGVTAHVRGGVH